LSYHIAQRIIFPALFFPLLGGREIYGVENVPATGGAVVAPNHVSYLDPPIVAACLPRPTYFMAKRELFEVPFLGWFIHTHRAFPVERGTADTAALRHAIDVVRQGQLLIIFPEGTRSQDGTIGEGELGCALVAGRACVPIIPCAVVGTDRMLPRGARFLRRARIYVAFGEPVSVMPDDQGRLTRAQLRAATEVLMSRLQALHQNLLLRREERERSRKKQHDVRPTKPP
jgi:1-acyl-sn-glycerol-3-phosphate acyltransferase